MRNHLLALLIATLATATAGAQNFELLYRQIDEAIEHSPEYVGQYERQIAKARQELSDEQHLEQKMQKAFHLYELYRPFVNDSAMYFLRRCASLADDLGNRQEGVRSRALLGLRCSNVGMYDEAIQILDSIQPAGLDTLVLGTYYQAYCNVYAELSYYTRLEALKQSYGEKAAHYEQLMLKTLPHNSEASFMRRELRAQGEGRLDESMRINDEWLSTVEEGSHPYAMVALFRYIEYKMRKDTVQMMHWLVESVLADIHNSVMDQGSMWELANELMLRGDIDRASRYISYTSDCAIRFGSRQRNWQISPLLSEIAKSYKQKSERTTSQLILLLAVISVLALLLLGLLFFLHRRNKQLALARGQLKRSNDELGEANQQLSSQARELSALNAQLSVVNSQLSETNRVKEEYLGRFMSLCSQYIVKLDDYRKMVNKKMKNKELDELYRLTKSTELKEKEIEELHENFDRVFLHLFPNFVEDFNQLLTADAQIRPKEEGHLCTELRIFALIRLGVDDSSKIAEFLHYSVNTIYNYRARIKNGAVGNRETFESRVKALGLPK